MKDEIPYFLIRDGLKLKIKKGYTVSFFIPEKYFDSNQVKQNGSYFDVIGIFLYNVYKNGKKEFPNNKLFNFPTIFTCKPDRVNKISNNSIYKDDECREFIFDSENSEVISSTQCIQYATTAEIVLKMILNGRIPKIIPYDELYKIIDKSARLNGVSFNTIAGLEGIIISELCRSEKDYSKLFINEYEAGKCKSTDYTILKLDDIPKYVSPYSALISYNSTISVAAALANDEVSDESALEKILLGNY